jgi:DNA polymerase III delta prime subunit
VFLPITGTEVPPIDKAFKACDLVALAESDLEKRKKLGSAIMLASNRVLSGEEKGELRKKMSMSALIDEDSIMSWADQSLVKELAETNKKLDDTAKETSQLKEAMAIILAKFKELELHANKA